MCFGHLYKVENIRINRDWNIILQSTTLNASTEKIGIEDKNETTKDSKNETPTKTLVHGYIGSQCIYDFQDKLIKVVPVEG